MTKNDILAYLDAGAPAFAPPQGDGASARQASAPGAPLLGPNPAATAGLDQAKFERTPMSVMRRKIAEHMVMSKRTSPHVHSAFEIDFTKVDAIRKAKKADYEKAGGKLTYMSFITKACAEALKKVPVVNASIDGTDVIYKKDINIGVAVALDWGLIVPVLKNVDGMSLLDISKAIADLAGAGAGKEAETRRGAGRNVHDHKPRRVRRPVRHADHQPATGGHRRRWRSRKAAGRHRRWDRDSAARIHDDRYDHRVIDGAIADEFMQVVKKMIENWDAAAA